MIPLAAIYFLKAGYRAAITATVFKGSAFRSRVAFYDYGNVFSIIAVTL